MGDAPNVSYIRFHHTQRGSKMNTNTKTAKVTLSELPELVDTYLTFKANGEDVSRLMNLIQDQTRYMEKRFWAIVDAKVGA